MTKSIVKKYLSFIIFLLGSWSAISSISYAQTAEAETSNTQKETPEQQCQLTEDSSNNSDWETNISHESETGNNSIEITVRKKYAEKDERNQVTAKLIKPDGSEITAEINSISDNSSQISYPDDFPDAESLPSGNYQVVLEQEGTVIDCNKLNITDSLSTQETGGENNLTGTENILLKVFNDLAQDLSLLSIDNEFNKALNKYNDYLRRFFGNQLFFSQDTIFLNEIETGLFGRENIAFQELMNLMKIKDSFFSQNALTSSHTDNFPDDSLNNSTVALLPIEPNPIIDDSFRGALGITSFVISVDCLFCILYDNDSRSNNGNSISQSIPESQSIISLIAVTLLGFVMLKPKK